MSNSAGLLNGYLLFAMSREGKEHTEAIENAINLSNRGTIALMKLMWQLGQLELSMASGVPDTPEPK